VGDDNNFSDIALYLQPLWRDRPAKLSNSAK